MWNASTTIDPNASVLTTIATTAAQRERGGLRKLMTASTTATAGATRKIQSTTHVTSSGVYAQACRHQRNAIPPNVAGGSSETISAMIARFGERSASSPVGT